MLTQRHTLQKECRIAASLAAIWFTLFVVLVPIFHRHADGMGLDSLSTYGQTTATPHDAGSAAATPVFHKTHGLNPQNADDCALCRWFSVGFTALCVFATLTVAAALAQLLFDVRLTELCRRPLPHRGLRAPPSAC